MKKILFILLLLFAFSCISFGANIKNTNTPGYVVLGNSRIQFKYHLYSHNMNAFELEFKELPTELKGTLVWSSSDENIAVVDCLGNITPKGPGKVTISVKSSIESNSSDSCEIYITPRVVGVIGFTGNIRSIGSIKDDNGVVIPSVKSVESEDTNIITINRIYKSKIYYNSINEGTTRFIILDEDNITHYLSVVVTKPIIIPIKEYMETQKLSSDIYYTIDVDFLSKYKSLYEIQIPNNLKISFADIDDCWCASSYTENSITFILKEEYISNYYLFKELEISFSDKESDYYIKTSYFIIFYAQVEEIYTWNKSFTIHTGLTKDISYPELVYVPEYTYFKEITCKSDNEEVATVSGNYEDEQIIIKGIKPGVANITLTSVDNPKASTTFTVTVVQGVESISLDQHEMNLYVNKFKKLTATVLPDNATNKNVFWSSDNKNIATVDSNGLVTGVTKGTTKIWVETAMGNFKDSCTVTVDGKEPTGIKIDKDEITVKKDKHAQLKAYLLPDEALCSNAIWKSDNKEIATVSNGLVYGVSPGETTITATDKEGNFSDKCKVIVLDSHIKVESISLRDKEIHILKGMSMPNYYTILPYDATYKEVTWSSSDTNIATVDSYGNIKGVSKGNAIITVKTKDQEKTDTCKVVVYNPVKVESISLNKTDLMLKINQSAQIYATIKPSNASNQTVYWESSDPKIATVTYGAVTGKKTGTVTITAITDDGNKKATCKVTVYIPATNVTINKYSCFSIYKGKTFQLSATVSPDNATDKKVKWASSDTKIATVSSSGLVKGIKAGTCNISVTTNDGKFSDAVKATILEPEIKVTSVKLNKTNLTLNVKDTYQLTASVLPKNATNKTISWISSDNKVASVSKNGLVTANKAGTAYIRAYSKSGTEAICTIKVVQPIYHVTSIKLNKTTLNMTKGDTFQLKTTISPSNATDKTVVWKLSDGKVLKVDSSGFITALKAGTATITVTTKDGNKTATCKVTVKEPTIKVTGIKLDKTSASISKNKTVQLKATVTPSNATDKTVSWASSNTKIATVSSSGLIKGIAKGTATITVTTKDGSKKATCKVTVK